MYDIIKTLRGEIMKTVAIIGAGAAGLVAASSLSRKVNNTKIMLFEQFNRSGKKILASGNGRCNISNKELSLQDYNTDNKEIEKIIMNFNPVAYFEEIGMLTKYTGNLLYPLSNQALTVKNTLVDSLVNVEVKEECKVLKINKIGPQYQVITTADTYVVDYIVIATGSCASKLSGEDNLAIIKRLGITTTSLYPSLVQLKTKPVYKQLKGVRIKCKVSLLVDNTSIDTKEGELLFTEYGVSGICIMQLSRHYYKYLDKEVSISIDLLPEYTSKEVEQLLMRRKAKYSSIYLAGIFNNKLASVLESLQRIDLKDWRFEITATNDYSQAQVMSGGVDLKEVNQNLESNQYQNLFIVGEALDVDGDCGGYNLHFAFASGDYVGKYIADRINQDVEN